VIQELPVHKALRVYKASKVQQDPRVRQVHKVPREILGLRELKV
jgi:hypothetical protein